MNDRELQCSAQHFGYWLADPKWLNAAVAAYKADSLPRQVNGAADVRHAPSAEAGKLPKEVYAAGDDPLVDPPLYTVDTSGVASVVIDGQITKGRSSFGGASSVRTRQALRRAEADADVLGIMQLIDSPGGTVSGQDEFTNEVFRIRQGPKPIHTHANGGMHSAALWAGVQAGFVSASPLTEIGSIGTVAAVHDLSGAYEKEGIKVHVISTGDMKGAFTPGTEVTDEMLAELQTRVEAINQFFLNGVKRGRGLGIEQVRAIADGRDWMAAEAQSLGLIDSVMSHDEAIANLRREIRQRGKEQVAKSRSSKRRMKLASL